MKSALTAAIVLAVALTSASAIPVYAAKNNAEFNNRSEVCQTYQLHYVDSLRKMRTAKTRAAKASARDEANWAINRGYAGGCAWVSLV